jgi:hypothetical protein
MQGPFSLADMEVLGHHGIVTPSTQVCIVEKEMEDAWFAPSQTILYCMVAPLRDQAEELPSWLEEEVYKMIGEDAVNQAVNEFELVASAHPDDVLISQPKDPTAEAEGLPRELQRQLHLQAVQAEQLRVMLEHAPQAFLSARGLRRRRPRNWRLEAPAARVPAPEVSSNFDPLPPKLSQPSGSSLSPSLNDAKQFKSNDNIVALEAHRSDSIDWNKGKTSEPTPADAASRWVRDPPVAPGFGKRGSMSLGRTGADLPASSRTTLDMQMQSMDVRPAVNEMSHEQQMGLTTENAFGSVRSTLNGVARPVKGLGANAFASISRLPEEQKPTPAPVASVPATRASTFGASRYQDREPAVKTMSMAAAPRTATKPQHIMYSDDPFEDEQQNLIEPSVPMVRPWRKDDKKKAGAAAVAKGRPSKAKPVKRSTQRSKEDEIFNPDGDMEEPSGPSFSQWGKDDRKSAAASTASGLCPIPNDRPWRKGATGRVRGRNR